MSNHSMTVSELIAALQALSAPNKVVVIDDGSSFLRNLQSGGVFEETLFLSRNLPTGTNDQYNRPAASETGDTAVVTLKLTDLQRFGPLDSV